MLQTDLAKIRYYAGKNAKRNWEFRSYLKSVDKEVEEIDSIVHGILEDVVTRIDCTACANCCKKMSPLVTRDELSAISKFLGISEEEFKSRYLKFDKEENEYTISKKPCPFLRDNICSIYEIRPEDCRSFPHVAKNEFVFRLIGVVENYPVCPIVFNVYEQLKREFRFRS